MTERPDDAHPYQALTPDAVLDALAGIGLHGDGRLVALNSYENRVYQVWLDDGTPLVVKFYRPHRWTADQILEEHALALELAAEDVPVVAPLSVHGRNLHRWAPFDFSVSPRRGGRQPELDNPEVLAWIGRFLARLHRVGERRPFAHRPALTPETLGHDSVNWLMAHEAVPPEARRAWHDAARRALEAVERRWHAVPTLAIRLHGDCHPGNILWTPTDAAGAGPHVVDLDDARLGPAVQDLWMLLSGDRLQQQRQLGACLDGYEQIRDFDRRELALIEPLRTLRLLHYSAWLARRWTDPIFPINFPWFGEVSHWHDQTRLLQEQTLAMEDEPLVA